MKRQGKLWSVLGLFFASFSLLVGSLAHLSGVGATEVGATDISSTFTNKNLSVGTGELGWTASKDSNSFESSGSARGVQFGAAIGSFTLTANNSYTNITSVSMVVSTNGTSEVNTIAVAVGTTNFKSGSETTYPLPKDNNQTVTFTGAATTGTVVISVNDENKSVYFKTITVTYSAAAQSSSAESSSDTSSSASSSESTNKAIYTVTTKNAVSASGTRPAGSDCSLVETYGTSKQMTSGNTQTYTFTGYGGTKIVGLTLSMKSNSGSGAGYLSFTTGSDAIASIGASNSGIAFNNAAWHGSWSSSYVDVTVPVSETTVDTGASVVLLIGATANSIYCQGVTIEWMDAGASSATSSESSFATPEVTITSNVEGNAFEVGIGLTYDFVVTLANAEPNTYKIAISGTGAISLSSGGASITSDTAISSDATVTATGSTKGSVTLTCTSVADSEKSVVISINVIKPFAPTGDAAGPYQLVKDPSEIAGDCYVIIVGGDLANDDAVALSTTQNTNNRGQTAVSVAEGELISSISADVQVLRLEKDEDESKWTLRENKNDGGYLYAASSSENYLRTKATNDANGIWSITINSTSGVASIVAQGTNTRNVLQYNGTSRLFSCYASASQSDVYIFKAITLNPVAALDLEDGEGNAIADASIVNVLTNGTYKFKGSVNSSATLKGVTYSAKDSSNNNVELVTDGDYRELPAEKYALRGDYTITVTSKGKTGGGDTVSKSFTIRVEDIAITTFEFRQDLTKVTALSIELNSYEDVSLYINPNNTTNVSGYVVPASSDDSVVSCELVEGKWRLTAESYDPEGSNTASITASITSQGVTKTATIVVTVTITEVTAINVTSSNPVSVPWHDHSQISWTVAPAGANITDVVFESDDTDVCTVSDTGEIYGVEKGTATITISAVDGSGITATLEVNVTKVEVVSFTLNYNNRTIYVDGTPATATIAASSWDPVDVSDKSLTFASSDETIAVVNASGVVSVPMGSSKLGTVAITVTSVSNPSATQTCNVTVKSKVSRIEFSQDAVSFEADADPIEIADFPFDIYSYDSDDVRSTVDIANLTSLISSDNSILEFVSGEGLYPYAVGRVTLTATYGDKTATMTVNVTDSSSHYIVGLAYSGTIPDCTFAEEDYDLLLAVGGDFELTAAWDDDSEVDVTSDNRTTYGWKDGIDHSTDLGVHPYVVSYAGFSVEFDVRTTNVGSSYIKTDKDTNTAIYSADSNDATTFTLTGSSTVFEGYETTNAGKASENEAWSGSGNVVKFGSGSKRGSFAVDMSLGESKIVKVTVEAGMWKQDGTSLDCFVGSTQLGATQALTPNLSNTVSSQLDTIVFSDSNGLSGTSLRVEAHNASNNRFFLKSVTIEYGTPAVLAFSAEAQATSFYNYIHEFLTCESGWANNPDTVLRLAQEFNAMSLEAKGLLVNANKSTFAYRDYSYGDGETAYDLYTHEYTDKTTKMSTNTRAIDKLYYMVALFNQDKSAGEKIYLYLEEGEVSGTGSSAGTKPYLPNPALLLAPIGGVSQKDQSPLTTTLWIVLGSGLAGLTAIGGAYLFSKKKQRRDTQA